MWKNCHQVVQKSIGLIISLYCPASIKMIWAFGCAQAGIAMHNSILSYRCRHSQRH
jgi:hypothetical protein